MKAKHELERKVNEVNLI